MSTATQKKKASKQAARDLREFDAELAYEGGKVWRRITMIDPKTSSDDLIAMTRREGSIQDQISDVVPDEGYITTTVGAGSSFSRNTRQRGERNTLSHSRSDLPIQKLVMILAKTV